MTENHVVLCGAMADPWWCTEAFLAVTCLACLEALAKRRDATPTVVLARLRPINRP